MKKIAIIVKNLELHGISTVVMNCSKRMDSAKFDITIFSGKNINSEYLNECEKNNIKIVELPLKNKNPIKYYVQLYKKMEKNIYDVCHVHGNSSEMLIGLLIAKIKKIKVRIAHCHTVKNKNRKVHKLLNLLCHKLYTEACACSESAGEWLFKDFCVVSNGIDLEEYIFDNKKREKIRKKLDIKDNEIVLGNVGRFNEYKNQTFLIELMEELLKKNKNIKLLLVGDGPQYQEMKEFISSKKIRNNIILYGETHSVNEIYSAMDVFVFPSKCEGLGIVAIEAQASGLPGIISDNVPSEIIINDNFTQLPLEISDWMNCIKNFEINNEKRKNINYEKMKKFSIKESVNLLEQIYTKERRR